MRRFTFSTEQGPKRLLSGNCTSGTPSAAVFRRMIPLSRESSRTPYPSFSKRSVKSYTYCSPPPQPAEAKS